MENEVLENLSTAVGGPVFERSGACVFHDPVVVEIRKMFAGFRLECVGHREDQHAMRLEQPTGVHECTGYGRRDVLEYLARNDEIVAADESFGHGGDVE